MEVGSYFVDYLTELVKKKKKYIVIICAKDNIGRSLTEHHAELLQELGIRTDLSAQRGLGGQCHRGFIAIIDGGLNTIEILAKNWKEAVYKDEQYDLLSTVYKKNKCDPAHVYINDDKFNYIPNKRGLNLVIIDKESREVLESFTFDTHSPDAPLRVYLDIRAELAKIEADRKKEEAFQNEYHEFILNFNAEALPKLKLAKPQHPFGETAFIAGISAEAFKNINECFSDEGSFNFKKISSQNKNGYVISTLIPKTDIKGIDYVFSGNAFYKGTFIFGEEDLNHEVDINTVKECMGEFELLTIEESKVEFGNDFFGFGRWFYYQKNGIFAVATSYHMLLLLLTEAEEQLDFNTDLIIANAGNFKWMSEQLFSEELEIKDVHLLLPDKKIVYDMQTEIAAFPLTKFSDEVNFPEKYDEERYEVLLYKAKDELIENMRAIFQHPRFEHIQLDMTDGHDSRNVLAIALNLPKNLQKKIRLHSWQRHTDDLKTACGIANMFDLEWDDIVRDFQVMDNAEGVTNSRISSDLGTYYLGNNKPTVVHRKLRNAIQLMGGNGAGGVGVLDQFGSHELPLDQYTMKQIKNPRIPMEFEEMGEKFFQITMKAFNKNASVSDAFTADKYYQLFRNRLHFKTKYRVTPAISPLQSYSAHRAKKMSLGKKASFAFQQDLIYILNPLLSRFPHTDVKQRKRVQLVRDNDLALFSNWNFEIVPNYDRERYDVALRNVPKEYLPDKDTYTENLLLAEEKEKMYNWLYDSDDALLRGLKMIIEKIPEFRDAGFEFYKFIYRKNTPEYKAFYNHYAIFTNKILSLYYQMAIVNQKDTSQ